MTILLADEFPPLHKCTREAADTEVEVIQQHVLKVRDAQPGF